LYNKDKTTLVAYPAGKAGTTFTIPNTVTSIGRQAFYKCTSITSIGGVAFYFCTSLTSVTFATGSNIPNDNFGDIAFPEGTRGNGGDTLKTAYSTGKAGTYSRPANGETWAKN